MSDEEEFPKRRATDGSFIRWDGGVGFSTIVAVLFGVITGTFTATVGFYSMRSDLVSSVEKVRSDLEKQGILVQVLTQRVDNLQAETISERNDTQASIGKVRDIIYQLGLDLARLQQSNGPRR